MPETNPAAAASKQPPPAPTATPAARTTAKAADRAAAVAEYSAAGALRNRTTQAANSTLTRTLDERHAKIYLAELGPRYNKDLLEATILLSYDGVSTAAPKRPAELAAVVMANPFGEPLGDSDAAPRGVGPNLLDVLFFSQLQTSPLRTDDQAEADVIVIGFWVHKLVKLDKELEKPNKHDLALVDFWREAKTLLPFLGKKPHVLVVPDKEADLRGTCGGRGLSFLCHPLAKHVTILTPEILTARTSIMTGARVSPGIIGELLDGNSVAVPEASGIHLSPSSPQWAPKFNAEGVMAEKTRLVAEALRARTPLRKALRSNCMAQPTKCTHSDPPAILHRDGPAFAAAVYEHFQDAWFCLQPPGDTALRVSLWQCILAGAIPVMFDPKALEILPFSDIVNWHEMVVLVTPDQVLGKEKDIIHLLESRYGIEDRLHRLARLQSVRHFFQYSLAPQQHLVHFDHLGEVTLQDDAFTMSLKALFRHLCTTKQLPGRCS